MKITAIAAAAAAALTLAAGTASAQDGTIDFTGSITATTCLVEGVAPGQGNIAKAVDLGGINVGSLQTAGERAGDKGFNIQVGGAGDANCTDGQTAHVRFDPASPALDITTGRLNIDNTGTPATNVQVEIANVDGTEINLFTEDSAGIVIANNTAVIPLIGRYYATGTAVAGEANSRVGFQVVYD
ncbi:fimbrial protein [Stenotrophomonas chelatiphaga]|uniref:fimbrial protein n=1 Tax=Stenotrophomonas chelatiphaga TaxID=517011 RepID=UPI0028A13C3E|nr:fimbrial protein [Stenotrophomonas chelatiphaga]